MVTTVEGMLRTILPSQQPNTSWDRGLTCRIAVALVVSGASSALISLTSRALLITTQGNSLWRKVRALTNPPFQLFAAKTQANLTFEELGKHLNRSEVAVAAIFYGQATASAEDVEKLSQVLGIPKEILAPQLMGFPDRGRAGPMPPVEPLIYRLYEVIQNYGYAYKAILNEKFGDGIMSAICFSTNVEKEVDADGAQWVVITWRGKWWVDLGVWSSCDLRMTTDQITGCLSPGSRIVVTRLVVWWHEGKHPTKYFLSEPAHTPCSLLNYQDTLCTAAADRAPGELSAKHLSAFERRSNVLIHTWVPILGCPPSVSCPRWGPDNDAATVTNHKLVYLGLSRKSDRPCLASCETLSLLLSRMGFQTIAVTTVATAHCFSG